MRSSTQKKRTRIIEVATELFIQHGYKATSLDQIVAECGGSKQTLYRYFANKEGLFSEVLSHNTKSSLEPVFQLAEKQNDDLQETLEDFAKQYLRKLCSNPVLALYRIITGEFSNHDTLPNQFWQSGPMQSHKDLVEYLETETVSQQLCIGDVQLACAQLLALIKLDYQNRALMGLEFMTDQELDSHAHKAITAFLSLYKC